MNLVDVVISRAVHSPDKAAMVAPGAAVGYGKLLYGIGIAERRLARFAFAPGSVAVLNIDDPLDHMLLTLVLYRLNIATLPAALVQPEGPPPPRIDLVISDRVLEPQLLALFGSASIVLFDSTWFQDRSDIALTPGSGTTAPGHWPCRYFAADAPASADLCALSALDLEDQLVTYQLSCAPVWERMITLLPLSTNPGLLLPLMALSLGRSVCFAQPVNARELAITYGHDYLVLSTDQLRRLVEAQRTGFKSLAHLRGAYVVGDAFPDALMRDAASLVCANLTCAYTTPERGVTAFAPSPRLGGVDGAVGLAAPWSQVEVVDGDGHPLPANQDGLVRLRRDPSPQDADGSSSGWISTGRRGHLRDDRLLVLTQ